MSAIIKGAEWNYEPAKARHVTGVVLPSPQFPMFWGKHLVGQRVHAVAVARDDGSEFYLYDDDGLGTFKVLHGGGPDSGHKSLELSDVVEFEAEELETTKS
jgi:hypothetical protein